MELEKLIIAIEGLKPTQEQFNENTEFCYAYQIGINDAIDLVKKLNIHDAIVPLCECGGNERVALDCTMKPCKY